MTQNYGTIGYPSMVYPVQVPGSGWPGYVEDLNFKQAIKKVLKDRWLIVHIQDAFDGWPGAGSSVTKWSMYMDNYGQVWKIYTEGKYSPERQSDIFVPLNTSNTPLNNKLIDIAKSTMSQYLGKAEFRGEGFRPPVIPPKNVLDSFVTN